MMTRTDKSTERLALAMEIAFVRTISNAAPIAETSMGVLFKNAEAIEAMRKIDILVVDKTGTLRNNFV